jgi:SAM-dependent methyltransferase
MKELREYYARGQNVMAALREHPGTNSTDAILRAYDLQAGSYVQAADADPAYWDAYTGAIARILDALSPDSIVEVGVGEATTLVNVVKRMRRPPRYACGFDLSWSRLFVAQGYARRSAAEGMSFVVGDLFAPPFAKDGFDVVYTSHSIEPNGGRELQALEALVPITRKHLVLLEPSYDLGSDATRRRIEEHGYVRDLRGAAEKLGLRIVEHRLFDVTRNEQNQTALLHLERPVSAVSSPSMPRLACPDCGEPTVRHQGNHFCEGCGTVYPSLGGIPCLVSSNGIVASRYLES